MDTLVKYQPPQRNWKDLTYYAIRAGLSSIPLVGAFVTEFFQISVSSNLERQQEQWMQEVGQSLNRLESLTITEQTSATNGNRRIRKFDRDNPLEALEGIELLLTATDLSYEIESELYLKKGLLFQQLGKLDDAMTALKSYAKLIKEQRSVDYYICLGKILSQKHQNPSFLARYLNFMRDKLQVEQKEFEVIASPLYWRMGTLWLKTDRQKADYYLSLHGEISSDKAGGYQMAHNVQCAAFSTLVGVYRGDVSTRYVRHFWHQRLHGAFLGYSHLNDFEFQEKCIASNLLTTALLCYKHQQPKRYYENLLIARKLFRTQNVRPEHEAMAEISGVLASLFPGEFELLFTHDLSKVVTNHADNALIRELYADVNQRWLNCNTHNQRFELAQEIAYESLKT